MSRRNRQRAEFAERRPAFTLVELLIVITLIGLLVALLLPAVQAAREAARRRTCQSNLGQLILAVRQYEMTHGVFPAGTVDRRGPIANWPKGYHHGWLVRVLPHLEHQRTLDHVDFTVSVYDPPNLPVRRLTIELLHCPSGTRPAGGSDYAAVHHDREAPIDVSNDGVFFLNSRIRHVQVSDGLSNTMFLGETTPDGSQLGWMSGTRATLRNTGWAVPGPGGAAAPAAGPPEFPLNADGLAVLSAARERELLRTANGKQVPNRSVLFVGGFSSPHPGGGIYALGDGSTRFLSSNITPTTYRRLGNRHDGKIMDDF